MDQDQDTPQQQQQLVEQTSPAALLPDVLLAAILQHVLQQRRLQHCAVVCQAWARAATAATATVQCISLPRAKLPALNSWLAEHGEQLELLQVTLRYQYPSAATADSVPLQLRCAELSQLTRLDLVSLQVELQLPNHTQPADGASKSSRRSSLAVPPAILPKLQQLRLSACTFTSSAALLPLPPLPRVTQLQFKGTLDNSAALHLVRCMPQLADLQLSISIDATSAAVGAAASSVTSLVIEPHYAASFAASSCLPLSAPRLAHVRHLTLRFAVFCPGVLASMPQLVQLKLVSCRILSVTVNGQTECGVAAFFAAMRGLQHLQQLELVDDDLAFESTLTAARPQDCAALTASRHLTKLVLYIQDAELLSRRAVQHMFPAGGLAQLRELAFTSGDSQWDDGGSPCLRAAGLQQIVSACPALCSLNITCAVRPSASVAALLRLPPTCCSLKVGGPAFGDKAASIVCQLTQLTDLSWTESATLTDAGLDQLTELQGLQRLYLNFTHGLSAEVNNSYEGFMERPIELKAGGKPVWQELQDLLAQNPSNAAWRRKLTQQQQAARILQQQTASRLQQRVADLAAYMQHALAVMAHCASDSSAVQLVQAMADIARTALSSDEPAGAGGGGGDGGGGDAADAGQLLEDDEGFSEDASDESESEEVEAAAEEASQEEQQPQQQVMARYLELQQQVLAATCDSSSEVHQALDAMEAIARKAILRQQQL